MGRSKPGLGKQGYNGCNASRMFWMRACVIACVRRYWWICQVSGQGVMWLLTGSQQACWELQQSVCPPGSTPTPSLDSPLLSQSSAPHICCVLATDSKLQPPGPLPDSIPISSRVPLLPPSPQRAINSPSLPTSVCLPPFLSFFSPCVCHIRLGSSTPSTPVRLHSSFLSFFHFCYSFVFFHCVTLQHTPPLPPFTFFQAGPCCLSFTGFVASPSFFLSFSLSPSHTHTYTRTHSHTHLPNHPHPLFLETDVVCQILSLLAN